MSTINVNNILAAYSPQGVVNLNGTNVSYNTDGTVIGIGLGALQICTGNNSVALGRQALSTVTTGGDNTGIGGGALGSTTGSDNTAIGFFAGATHTTGSNNTFVGHSALGSSTTANNEITLGNSANSVLRCAVTTITSLSDARDKKEVTELRTGLDFINALIVTNLPYINWPNTLKGFKDELWKIYGLLL